eukprot:6274087-Amphidinium_carterae.2
MGGLQFCCGWFNFILSFARSAFSGNRSGGKQFIAVKDVACKTIRAFGRCATSYAWPSARELVSGLFLEQVSIRPHHYATKYMPFGIKWENPHSQPDTYLGSVLPLGG